MKRPTRALLATALAASALTVAAYVARADQANSNSTDPSVVWESAPETAQRPTGELSGLKVARDPDTGELRAPAPGELGPGHSGPGRGSQVVQAANGVFLIAGDDLMSDITAAKRDGVVVVDCGTGGPHNTAGHRHVEK